MAGSDGRQRKYSDIKRKGAEAPFPRRCVSSRPSTPCRALPVGRFLTPWSLVFESCLKLNLSDIYVGSLHIRFLFRRRQYFRIAWRLSQRRATSLRTRRGGVLALTPKGLAVRQNASYHLKRFA